MKSILLASSNKGKVLELAAELQKLQIVAESLCDYPDLPQVEEIGQSFEENALIKAREIAKLTGKIVLSDDSGLVVPALSGAPGIYSSRFAEDMEFLPGETKDQRNIRKLLLLLNGRMDREALFKTVIAVVTPQGRELTASGQWRGEILTEPRGVNGFGYDPVFFDPMLGKTAAELDGPTKNLHSHRGKAIRAIMEKLPDFLAGK